MYWVITFGWTILGCLILWTLLSIKWNRIDPLISSMFHTMRRFHGTPGTEGYLDLKFSVLRHSVVFLLSALVIALFDSRFMTSVISFVNLLYCWMPIARYRYRKKELHSVRSEGSAELAGFMAIPIKDSFCTVVHAVISTVLIYILPIFM